MFYRYISENLCNFINDNERNSGNKTFNYAELDDKKAKAIKSDIVKIKGFFLLPSELFENVRKNASSDENLNMTLEQIFKNIESSAKGTDTEKDIQGLFEGVDVNSNKLGNTVANRNKKLV